MSILNKMVDKEMQIRGIIFDRSLNYSNILKTELTLAKNVIKNPKLFKNVNRTLTNEANKYQTYAYKEIIKDSDFNLLRNKQHKYNESLNQSQCHQTQFEFDPRSSTITIKNKGRKTVTANRSRR